jgi:hypothetical protein
MVKRGLLCQLQSKGDGQQRSVEVGVGARLLSGCCKIANGTHGNLESARHSSRVGWQVP